MLDVLDLPENDIVRRSSFARLYNNMNEKRDGFELRSANGLWLQENYPFVQEYIDVIGKYYMAETGNLDFANDPEGSRKVVNDWVEEQTDGRIKDIVAPGDFDALTRMAVANALHFLGNWDIPFDEEDTYDEEFTTDMNKTVTVPMMHLGDEAGYFDNEEVQIVKLDYQGNQNSMLLVLPWDNDIDHLIQNLSVEKLQAWRSGVYNDEIDLSLPKFSMDLKYDLEPTLIDMGMGTAFTAGADLRGLSESGELFVDGVVHQATIDVNEEGTEASAATVAWVAACIPPTFCANRPFLFMIQDNETGNILFMGKLVDPLG
jgi:serpin B